MSVRLIVACTDCRRQYDATGRQVGSRFRCHCGVVVAVQEPRAHHASAVRCSSCGAARDAGALDCSHCGTTFTLHERDLDTVCASCLTRISNRAKFCHSCGTAVAVEGAAGEQTGLSCPACGGEHRLTSRALGQGLSVLECGRCAGMWLGNDTFEHVVSRAEEVSTTIHGAGSGPERARTQTIGAQGGPAYRPCIRCGKLMNRRNYGKRSNVIIDVCKEHGVWFDAEELGRILQWVRAGGLESMREAEREKLRDEQRRKNREPMSYRGLGEASEDRGPDILGDLIRMFW